MSADGGKTFGAPVTTGMTGLSQITVRAGPASVACVAGTTSAGPGSVPSLALPVASDTVIVSDERGGAIWAFGA